MRTLYILILHSSTPPSTLSHKAPCYDPCFPFSPLSIFATTRRTWLNPSILEYPTLFPYIHALYHLRMPFRSTRTIPYDSIRYTSLSYPILPYLLAQKQKQSALFALLFGSMVLLVSSRRTVCLLIDYRSPVFLLVRIPASWTGFRGYTGKWHTHGTLECLPGSRSPGGLDTILLRTLQLHCT